MGEKNLEWSVMWGSEEKGQDRERLKTEMNIMREKHRAKNATKSLAFTQDKTL